MGTNAATLEADRPRLPDRSPPGGAREGGVLDRRSEAVPEPAADVPRFASPGAHLAGVQQGRASPTRAAR